MWMGGAAGRGREDGTDWPSPALMPPHRESSAETDREPQQLQNYWSEVRYMVRCIYRQAGTPLADDQDQSLVPDKEGVKELVDRYTCPPCRVPPGPGLCLEWELGGSASGSGCTARRQQTAGKSEPSAQSLEFWFAETLAACVVKMR